MSQVVHIDFETRSKANIKKAGAYAYLEHPSARVMCMAYTIGDQEPRIWWPSYPLVRSELQFPERSTMMGCAEPEELFDLIRSGAELWAHNATFERAVFELICGPRMGWPVPKPEQWRCTMAMCAAHALPLSLDGACHVLNLRNMKDKEGSRIMRKVSSPRKPTKKDESLWNEDPKDLRTLFEYCKQDVRAERELAHTLRPLSDSELRVYQADQAINFRGIAIDSELCDKARTAGELYKLTLDNEVHELTGGDVETLTQVSRAKSWLSKYNVEVEDLRKETVRDMLAHDDEARESVELDEEVGYEPMPSKPHRFLELRAAGGKTSVAKYDRFLRMACSDGRVRGGYQYHGARTGRWAGRGVQLHNLPKGVGEPEQYEVIDALKSGGIDLLSMLYLDPMAKLSKIIRGVLVAPEGRKFVIADYAAIEARGVFWLSGQETLLELYRQGQCLYSWMAGHVFDCNPDDVLAGHKAGDPEMTFRRFVGKQLILGCGYGMGHKKFVSYCAQMGQVVTVELAKLAVGIYRERAPQVKEHWKGVERAAVSAVRSPGEQFQYRYTKWKKVGRFLHCQLPSGRILSYYRPTAKKETVRYKDEETGEVKVWDAWKLRYEGMKDGRWGRIGTFGGMLTENVCQAVSRDLTADAIIRLEDDGKEVVLHSHDEIGTEVDLDSEFGVPELEKVMEQAPAWAAGLPVKVEGFECARYRK